MRTILYGDEYMKLHESGNIERTNCKPSGQWCVIGAYEHNNFGHVIRVYTLQDILTNPGAIPWRFKNGKQRTIIRDLDHGTVREWGNPHLIF